MAPATPAATPAMHSQLSPKAHWLPAGQLSKSQLMILAITPLIALAIDAS